MCSPFIRWIRPYCAESTASHPNSEVNLRQAVLVLGWATTRESTVPYPFSFLPGHVSKLDERKRTCKNYFLTYEEEEK